MGARELPRKSETLKKSVKRLPYLHSIADRIAGANSIVDGTVCIVETVPADRAVLSWEPGTDAASSPTTPLPPETPPPG